MGSKHELASAIAQEVALLAPRKPCLDLFSGMCSVAAALSRRGHPAWTNDVSPFAAFTARTLLTARRHPPTPSWYAKRLSTHARSNQRALEDRFGRDIERERSAVRFADHSRWLEAVDAWDHAGNNSIIASELQGLRQYPETFPYRLTTLSFSWGYFGVEQSVWIDSIRYALDQQRLSGVLSEEQHAWGLLALLVAVSRCSNSPGHFAQFLRGGSAKSLQRVKRQRRRHIGAHFLRELASLRPLATVAWRDVARVFNHEALQLLEFFRHQAKCEVPAVMYADPPYSTDHYSRYYHVLDTLYLYDYPESHGIGRCRADRFVTGFSVKSRVRGSFLQLAQGVAALGASLVLSYPTRGLLAAAGYNVEDTLRTSFRTVKVVREEKLSHSTLGGRHGSAEVKAVEQVWVARP